MPFLLWSALFLFLFLTSLPAEAVHDQSSLYSLFAEGPARKIESGLEKEFRQMAPSEIFEYARRGEDDPQTYRLMPEVLRPLGAGAREFGGKFFLFLSEEVELLGRIKDLVEKYNYPHVEWKLDEKRFEASLRKPAKENPLGIRFGVSSELNIGSIDEVFLPGPYVRFGLGGCVGRIRYSPIKEIVRGSLDCSAKVDQATFLSALYEYDIKRRE